MDAFEGLSDHRADAKKHGTLRRPVARRSGSILLPGDHDQRSSAFLVFHRGVIDEYVCAAFLGRGPPTLGSRSELIAKANVGKGAAHHDFVISAPLPTRAEAFSSHPLRAPP